ncbi:MAG: HNH endonuclease [Dehalococcoidales bacterium]|nr:HNH endonuclease [Dehalococcoidales bacterium]
MSTQKMKERMPVLVLNSSFQPLSICQVRRAIVLIHEGKAEMVENGMGFIHTISQEIPLPTVIRLDYMVRPPRHKNKLTRIGVFRRDGYTCQYCGKQSTLLTIDHIVPSHRGGEHKWTNVASACPKCNHRKAGRTPEEANMKLTRKPFEPSAYTGFYLPHRYTGGVSTWDKYLYHN